MSSSPLINDLAATRIVKGLIPGKYDKVVRADINATTEQWTYTLSTTTMGVVEVEYNNSAHDLIVRVERIS